MGLDALTHTLCSNINCKCPINFDNFFIGKEDKIGIYVNLIISSFFESIGKNKISDCNLFISGVEDLLARAKEYQVDLDPLPEKIACCFQQAIGVCRKIEERLIQETETDKWISIGYIIVGLGLMWGAVVFCQIQPVKNTQGIA